jgi:hypothetical protein
VVLAIAGTHRPFPVRDAWTKQRPFPPRGFCCPVGSSGTTAASDALPARHPLPGITGYRARRSDGNLRRPPGRGGPPQFPSPPSERSAPHTPGGSSGLRFQALRPFHGLRPDDPGSAPPLSHPQAGWLTTRQASLDATDRSVAPPEGLSTLGFDPARFQTEPPACYRASWQLPGRDSHPLATTSLCSDQVNVIAPPPNRWAHVVVPTEDDAARDPAVDRRHSSKALKRRFSRSTSMEPIRSKATKLHDRRGVRADVTGAGAETRLAGCRRTFSASCRSS